ncbi:MAG: hypothetical protein CV087_20225 [Candidatus Brocadia sp. WS118]|nr:MAG: hypothetical protein CV087_20225 [Candidatus Brocadia sp. WS118]
MKKVSRGEFFGGVVFLSPRWGFRGGLGFPGLRPGLLSGAPLGWAGLKKEKLIYNKKGSR